jgi:hypothetical protein
MNKEYMRETITFTAKDKDGNKVESTPHLFMEALSKATGTTISEIKTKISKSSSRFKNMLARVLNEERLPTGGELMSLTTILGTKKDKVEKAFAAIVKAGTISSNGTKASEVNTLNLQFTWPKNWGENVKEIGEALCEIFRSGDFKNDSLFCNYTGSNDTVTVAADSGKFESAQSFGKLIEALRTVINYIYINSPFDASVNELDEPMYKLVDDAVYSTLHEVAVNGVEEGVDLAPLQKYLYQKGVVNLPNVNDDKVDSDNQGKKYEKAKTAMMEKVKAFNDSFKPFDSEPIHTNRPYVMINASNVGNSVIRTIAESFNGNVDICIEAIDVGNIEISE